MARPRPERVPAVWDVAAPQSTLLGKGLDGRCRLHFCEVSGFGVLAPASSTIIREGYRQRAFDGRAAWWILVIDGAPW